MYQDLIKFYERVLKKTHYWLPVIVFTLAGYGFDLFNRSVSTDGLWEGYMIKRLQFRWGQTLWDCLLGATDISPYIDKFIGVIFLLLFAVSFCFLLYLIGKTKDVLVYTITSAFLITYPLISEIWNYTGANYYVSGGLVLATWAAIVMRSQMNTVKQIIISSLLMILPAASYEATVFSYFVIICIGVFYEFAIISREKLEIKKWLLFMLMYVLPVVIALSVRYLVSGLLIMLGIPYQPVGATGLAWLSGANPLAVIITIIGSNGFLYGVKGLVCFPITLFVVASVLFLIYIVKRSIMERNVKPLLLGIVLMMAVFSLAILQGSGMPYRTAQTVGIFVSFCSFLLLLGTINGGRATKNITLLLLLGICWHQSVYLNKVLALNNQRSDTEAAMVQNVGFKIISEYDKKPIVFVSSYAMSNWVAKRTQVDENSWNGILYHRICAAIGINDSGKTLDNIYQTSVNPFIKPDEVLTPPMIFRYYGFDFEVITTAKIIKEATDIARKEQMRPYTVLDNGDYLIVQLSAERYFCDYLNE